MKVILMMDSGVVTVLDSVIICDINIALGDVDIWFDTERRVPYHDVENVRIYSENGTLLLEERASV